MKTIYDLNPMPRAYLECAAWCTNDESTPQGGQPFDALEGWRDLLAPEVIERAEKDCEAFKEANQRDLGGALDPESAGDWSDEQAGHDLWLTRCGHGSGFWDRDFGSKAGRQSLSDAARAMGNLDLYLGDDGRIYFS